LGIGDHELGIEGLGIEGHGRFKEDRERFKFICDDILTFKGYREFDILYFYCPLQMHDAQQLFVAHLTDNMKKGAIVTGQGPVRNLLDGDKRFISQGGYGIFQKITEENINDPAFKRQRTIKLNNARRKYNNYLKKYVKGNK
jgi:hypothetical protein